MAAGIVRREKVSAVTPAVPAAALPRPVDVAAAGGSHPTTLDVTAAVARNSTVATKIAKFAGPKIGTTLAGDVTRLATKALPVLGKLAVPITVAAAGVGAYQEGKRGYEKDGVGGAAAGALRGAADSLTLGLASWAFDKATKGPDPSKAPGQNISDPTTRAIVAWNEQNKAAGEAPKMTGPAAAPTRGGAAARGMQKFNGASKDFTSSRAAPAKEPGAPGARGQRGFANPKVQAAAQRAKGNNYTGPEE